MPIMLALFSNTYAHFLLSKLSLITKEDHKWPQNHSRKVYILMLPDPHGRIYAWVLSTAVVVSSTPFRNHAVTIYSGDANALMFCD